MSKEKDGDVGIPIPIKCMVSRKVMFDEVTS
jgi:hypothetical protein